MKKMVAICVLSVAISGMASATMIGPSSYSSFMDSPFYGGAFDYFHLESFDDGYLTPGVGSSVMDIRVRASTDAVDADDGVIDGFSDPTLSMSLLAKRVESITFTFDETILYGLPTHVGVVWTDVGQAAQSGFGTVKVAAFDADGNTIGVMDNVAVGDGVSSTGLAPTEEDRFFGAMSLLGIKTFVISMPYEGYDSIGRPNVQWEVDHLQYGKARRNVPDSATTMSLLATGAAIVLIGFRRFCRA